MLRQVQLLPDRLSVSLDICARAAQTGTRTVVRRSGVASILELAVRYLPCRSLCQAFDSFFLLFVIQ
jgi:hypothetical protein